MKNLMTKSHCNCTMNTKLKWRSTKGIILFRKLKYPQVKHYRKQSCTTGIPLNKLSLNNLLCCLQIFQNPSFAALCICMCKSTGKPQ